MRNGKNFEGKRKASKVTRQALYPTLEDGLYLAEVTKITNSFNNNIRISIQLLGKGYEKFEKAHLLYINEQYPKIIDYFIESCSASFLPKLINREDCIGRLLYFQVQNQRTTYLNLEEIAGFELLVKLYEC